MIPAGGAGQPIGRLADPHTLPPHSRLTVPLIHNPKEDNMSVARVTEIISASTVSFDDAIKKGVARACETLKNVEGAWVKDQKMSIKNSKIVEYRVNLKVTFVLAE
jgi:dodecin